MVQEEKNKKIVWKEILPMSIIDERKQLSIRIPKKVVEALDINPEKDEFVFFFDKEHLHLTGELISKKSQNAKKNNK